MQVSISSKTIPQGHDLKRAKTLPPRDNHCVQKLSPRDRTGSEKPHPWDIKLENFTNISINSDTEMKSFVVSTNNEETMYHFISTSRVKITKYIHMKIMLKYPNTNQFKMLLQMTIYFILRN